MIQIEVSLNGFTKHYSYKKINQLYQFFIPYNSIFGYHIQIIMGGEKGGNTKGKKW